MAENCALQNFNTLSTYLQFQYKAAKLSEIMRHKSAKFYTVFLLINAPGAVQSIDREPLFCTQFEKQKVSSIVSAVQVF